jgi:2-polyprenyl-6-hydroxyphenyl methylase/3-demethylubiquinone-9 3-methyltransferase
MRHTAGEPYAEFGYSDEKPLCCAPYVYPRVLELAADSGPGARVLDIGCGNGRLAGALIENGYRVVGVDLSEQGIRIARARYPGARFEVMPADEEVRARLGERPFDLVVSTELIEHLYAPQPFLRGCFDAVRPGGRLIVSTPYHGYWKNLLIAAAGKFDDHVHPRTAGGHIKFWSRRTLFEALRDEGFVELDFHGVGRAPFLWRSMVVAARRPD